MPGPLGTARSQHLPPTSSGWEREVLGYGSEGPRSASPRAAEGTLTSTRLILRLGALRVGPEPWQQSAGLGALGARAAGHAVGAGSARRVRRCRFGALSPPPPPPLLPPESAREGLSRPELPTCY